MSDGLATLMRYQMEAEFALAHKESPWVTKPSIPWKVGVPTTQGTYLVSVDHGEGMKSTRLEYFDGLGWPRMGGYARVYAWAARPDPMEV